MSLKSKIKVALSCANCGKTSEYTEEELAEAFPFSRERLKCRHCHRILSVCSFMVKGGKTWI